MIYKARREASGGTNSADTLILDFQPPELRYFCCFCHPVCSILLLQPEQTNTVCNRVSLCIFP